jgi:hypothetical protein
MFATLVTVALFILPAIHGVLAQITMPTPQLTQCQDAQITWSQTQGPYNLVVLSAADICGTPLFNLGDFTNNQMTWSAVPIAAGTQVVLSVEDINSNEAWTGTITVGSSSDSSCLSSTQPAANAGSNPTGTTVVASSRPSSSAVAAGAANAGLAPVSGAPAIHQISTSVLTISAFIGALVLFL